MSTQNDEQKMRAALGANCLLSLDWEYVTVIKNIGVQDSGQGVQPRTRNEAAFGLHRFQLISVLEAS